MRFGVLVVEFGRESLQLVLMVSLNLLSSELKLLVLNVQLVKFVLVFLTFLLRLFKLG